jgi:hypothetical protein
MGHRNGSAPVRWREMGWEYRCESCVAKGGATSWWPLTEEFWIKSAGMTRCRACWHEHYRRQNVARRRASPELTRAHDRARYRRNRRVLLIKRREYYDRNRDYIRAKAKERYERRRDERAAA